MIISPHTLLDRKEHYHSGAAFFSVFVVDFAAEVPAAQRFDELQASSAGLFYVEVGREARSFIQNFESRYLLFLGADEPHYSAFVLHRVRRRIMRQRNSLRASASKIG